MAPGIREYLFFRIDPWRIQVRQTSPSDASEHADSCETFLKQWVRECGPLTAMCDEQLGPGQRGGSADWFDDRAVGRQIGAFRLIRRIGEGGMGVVWLAEQRPPLRRKVAVKFLKPDYRHRAIRFEIEQQSLAMLSHRHIAQIIDAGVAADGQPYYAMEYLEGVDLITYANRHGLGEDGRRLRHADLSVLRGRWCSAGGCRRHHV